MRHLLGAHSITPLPLAEKLHYTLEQEGDRFFLVDTGREEEKFIANIEWQVKNDSDMAERMLLYHAMRYKTDKIPIKGFVVYVGNEPLRMRDCIAHFQLQYGFELIDLRGFETSFFLQSNEPEEVIMALLTGFDSGEAKRELVKKILDKLHQLLDQQPRELQRRIRQMEVLGKLRDVQNIIIEEVENMATLYELYDIKTDIRYLQGVEEGILQGEKRGEKKGEKRGIKKGLETGVIIGQTAIIEHMLLNHDFPASQIASLLGVSESMVALVQQRLQKKAK